MICAKELDILKALNFNIGKPIALNFLRRNSKAGYVGVRHHSLAKYILEESFTNYPLACVKPSEKASAALLISMKILDPEMSLQVCKMIKILLLIQSVMSLFSFTGSVVFQPDFLLWVCFIGSDVHGCCAVKVSPSGSSLQIHSSLRQIQHCIESPRREAARTSRRNTQIFHY